MYLLQNSGILDELCCVNKIFCKPRKVYKKENEGISYTKLCSYTGVNSEITTINRNTLYLLAILGNTVTKWYLWLLRLLSRSGVSKCSPGPRQPQLHITFNLISKAGLCKWSAWNSYKRILLLSLQTAAWELKKMSENKGKTWWFYSWNQDRAKWQVQIEVAKPGSLFLEIHLRWMNPNQYSSGTRLCSFSRR